MEDSLEQLEDDDLLKKNLLQYVFTIGSDPFEVTTFSDKSVFIKVPVFTVITLAFISCVACLFILHQLRRNRQICFRTCLLNNFFWIKLVYLTKTFLINLIVSTPKNWPSWLNRSAHLFEFYFETIQYVLIFLIWLTLLIERNLIHSQTFKFNNNKVLSLNMIYEDTESKEAILEFKLIKNRQKLILVCAHFFVLLFSFLGSICLENNKVYGVSKLISDLFEIFFNSFFSQSFLLFSLLLWRFFGGARDPIKHQLTENELNRIKFIKIASILTSLNESLDLFVYYHNKYSSHRNLPTYVVELFEHLFTLIIAVLFIFNERSVGLFWWSNRVKRTESFDYILDSPNGFVQNENEQSNQN